MSVAATSYYDSLLQSSNSNQSVNITTDAEASSLSSEDFLTLLVTQMKYQDPSDPLDNTEMVNQLTQYSQLDELTSLNEKLDDLSSNLSSMTASNGLEYLGKQIEASGRTIAKSDDGISTLYYELGNDASSLTFNIYNETGSIIDTMTATNMKAGSYALNWDGTDSSGNTVANGNFIVLASATNSEGASIDVPTTTSGTVSDISSSDKGVILTLDDGRTVNMLDVTHATL